MAYKNSKPRLPQPPPPKYWQIYPIHEQCITANICAVTDNWPAV